MSESDVANNPEKARRPCDNDCFADTFISLMDERFRSHVAVKQLNYGNDEKGARRLTYDGRTSGVIR